MKRGYKQGYRQGQKDMLELIFGMLMLTGMSMVIFAKIFMIF